MVSPSQQTFKIRCRKRATSGKENKKNGRYPTPVFPIHQEGYPSTAPDARPEAKAADNTKA
jgi:hypothetical protein